MNESEVRKIAQRLLEAHELHGWKIAFGNAIGRGGSCNYRTKTLRFSRVVMKHNTRAGTQNTITHEVAHAIAGPGAGHGPEWQRVHRRLGGDGRRYMAESQLDTKSLESMKKNLVLCMTCETIIGRSTRKIKTEGIVHRTCGGDLQNVHMSQIANYRDHLILTDS